MCSCMLRKIYLAISTPTPPNIIPFADRHPTSTINLVPLNDVPFHNSNSLVVIFSNGVAEGEKEDITTQIHAHHTALPADHPAKAAICAIVAEGWDPAGWNGRVKFGYHSGYPRAGNKLGETQAVSKPLEVKFGGDVPQGERACIAARVRAHHSSLPADHAAKPARAAKVRESWHTTSADQRVRVRVLYYLGYPRGRTRIGSEYDVYY